MDITDMTRPKFPPGTPEYEAYAAELAVELKKFAAGEPPYHAVRPTPPVPLVEGGMYLVTTADARRIIAFYKPIDGIKANHPWVGEDEARHRSDAVTGIRPVMVIDPEVTLHKVAAMLAMGNATAHEIVAAIGTGVPR
jgi:hypothetical protein